MVIFGSSGAEARPAWTRMVAVVYGSEGGELIWPAGSCGGSSKKVFFRVGMGVWATPSHYETQP